jgi:arabinofuranan 3-O-arabinosyltransferase
VTGALAIVVAVGAVLVACWLFLRYPGFLVGNVANPDPKAHVDFETFHRSSVALLHRADTYHTGSLLPNLNPPLLALLLAPFGLLPAAQAYWAFTVVSLAVMTFAVVAVARELRLGARWVVLAVLTLWAGSPTHGTLVLGQIYGLLLLGVSLGWLAQRRGRPVLSGVALGLVVATKPSLAPVLLIPLVQRRPVPLWSGILGAGVATVVGVLAAGPSSAVEWIRLASGTPAPEVDANASLPGLVARLGGPGAVGWALTVVVVAASLWWVRRAAPHGGEDPGSVGSATVPGSVGSATVPGSVGSATVPGFVGSATVPGFVGSADAALFAVVAGCLLAAPIAWLNYTVLLWPGALVLARAGRWRVALPLLVVPVIPVAWGNLWQADPHSGWALLGRSLYCMVLLGYWIALLRMSATVSDTAIPDGSIPDGSIPDGTVAVGSMPGTAGSASSADAAGSTSMPDEPSGSPSSHNTPVGETLSTADAGRPCHDSPVAHTAPRLPTPEPP